MTERMYDESVLPIRGFLMHITHYDPRWWAVKEDESPFDLTTGVEVIDAMAAAGLNLLVIDCADGVRYASHPELARHYSVSMTTLEALVDRADDHGIEVVPKLNFSQSGLHRHNHWFRPHNDLFDSSRYWELAFEVIDELIDVMRPPRFFHVGMDEDHWRSYDQYVVAIQTLHAGLANRDLRTVIWNDSACLWPQAAIHLDKSLAAEQSGPQDVVHVVWDYNGAKPDVLARVREGGYELWGAPGREPSLVSEMREAVLAAGGTGILLTRWVPCVADNRDELLDHVRTLGPLCTEG
ncbi:MAG: hypothetical protein ACP5JG_10705 [Anaerolineae bacterium]